MITTPTPTPVVHTTASGLVVALDLHPDTGELTIMARGPKADDPEVRLHFPAELVDRLRDFLQ